MSVDLCLGKEISAVAAASDSARPPQASSASDRSSSSEAPTAVGSNLPRGDITPLADDKLDGGKPGLERSSSHWGQPMAVDAPLSQDDPRFLELRRSLSRHSAHSNGGEEKFSLEKRLRSHMARSEDIKNKRLDVAWKGLSVRGVGGDAQLADDLGS